VAKGLKLEHVQGVALKFRAVAAGKTGTTKTRIAAAGLLLTACTLVSLNCNPKVDSRRVPGLVLEIEALGIITPGVAEPQCRVLIAVGDSTETHLLLPPPVPLPGHFIPLTAEYYRKGNVAYSLDLKNWLAKGPS
jgi:hypothetical protein